MKTAGKKATVHKMKILTLVLMGSCLIWATAAAQGPAFLKGRVTVMEEDGNLKARMETAGKIFLREGTGDYYMTGYVFQSRLQLDYRSRNDGPFDILIRDDRIKIDWGRGNHVESSSTDKENEPAGLLFLHNKNGEILSARLIDLDNTYTVEDVHLYWLGEGETADSLETCKNIFKAGPDKLRGHMLWVISSHPGPRPMEFLEDVATGGYSSKVRREAVFWIGNSKDPKSLGILKRIFANESDEKVREHIIFAMSLGQGRDVVKEIIHIAKTDKSTKVRRQAIFWLGQMATKESIGALKNVVKGDDTDADIELKKHALFALTQTKDKEAEDMIFDIAKNHKNPHLRKTAMFWLGEMNSDRALELYEKILLKK
jgi:hypothetical protein